MLETLAGRSMLEHVWRATTAAGGFDRVVVATDAARVADVARGFGADAMLTGPAPSGTARAALVAPPEIAVAVVQADLPLLDGAHLDLLRGTVERAPIGTLWTPYVGDPGDSALVKVRLIGGLAVDFARHPWPDEPLRRHVGLYAFRPGWLSRCATRAPSERARREDLEQLTWLEAGVSVAAAEVHAVGPSVDTPQQLAQVRATMARSA